MASKMDDIRNDLNEQFLHNLKVDYKRNFMDLKSLYSVGSFNDLAPYVLVLYPQTETPYIYVRALINYGLVKIGEIIKEKGMPAIYSLCD